MTPYCTANNSLSLVPDGSEAHPHLTINVYIGILYLSLGAIGIPLSCFVLSVFCTPALFDHPCYKLMVINNILDIWNLVNACIFGGLFSVFELTHCTAYFVSFVASTQFAVWFAYCGSSQVLALNRTIQFVNKDWAEALFAGRRTYLWMAVPCLYSAGIYLAVPDPFYFYNPYEGSYYFPRTSGEVNFVQVFGNFFKTGFVTTSYVLMVIFMFKDLKKVNREATLMFQVKVSMQTLAIAALGDLVALAYMGESYLPLPQEFLKYAGTVAQLLWILLHAGTAVVYIIMNKSVNAELRKHIAFLKGCKHRAVASVTGITSAFSN
ncbi:hypothetical protein QR680_016021 [Steinernema hermaphroditum]|uniref:7TM GPCR serpentine receptor class x (Srx) domain-containing protein n=1 Tax=Steinernema hermaphroditum TaxID=289476 RepID=A0AA39H9S2_9BILA|nr:hypothetical protein QR680_016021 [Steinernema hermaphroditum]